MKSTREACIDLCNFQMEYLVMITTGTTVEDNETNLETCKRFCGACPTFKTNKLEKFPPQALFCARGKSSTAENARSSACYCPACELFTKDHLNIGHFCTKG
ncbi:MAG: DUF2769 domain-containing protein [Methanoregula sp.]|nr:DUF2769 domain-containing protein [Methanoregula sp.]